MLSENKDSKLLSVEDLVVQYKSDGQIVHAVNGVSFDLERGRTLGLVGETGAGKTTLAKSIMRILPDYGAEIVSGSVCLNGTNLTVLSEKKMRDYRGNQISMMFQDPMTALNPTMRVGDQITEVISRHNKVSKAEAEKRAKEMFAMVGISSDRFKEYPHQFSGGMKQRVVIAMALACEPDLLLADEPTTALDVTIQAQVLELINNLKTQRNMAMVLITHDLSVVAETCDDVAVMYAGQILEYGDKYQIFDHPSHPYTQGLFDAIPSMNTDEEWLKPIDGLPPDPTDLPPGCPFAPRCKYATPACDGKIEFVTTPDGHKCRCCNLEGGKAEWLF